MFVSVSVVVRPTKVEVAVGSVRVPVFIIVEMIGLVSVLLVSVSVVARPTRVSVEVGSVKTALPFAIAPVPEEKIKLLVNVRG